MSDSGPPKLKEFARRLLAYEAATGKPAGPNGSAAFGVCEKLRGPLAKNLGIGGLCALMARAMALAGAEVPWLRALRVKADCSLEGFDELEEKPDSRALAEGEVVLVAQLLGLLVTFIGPALTLPLLHDIWPKMDDLNF